MELKKTPQMITMTPKLKRIKSLLKEQGYKFTIFAELAIKDAIKRELPTSPQEKAPIKELATIYLSSDIVDWLNTNTKPTGSKNAFMRQAVEHYAKIKGI